MAHTQIALKPTFSNTLSAGRQQRTKTKPKERKDYYYANQSKNTKGLQIGQSRRGNRESQRILLRLPILNDSLSGHRIAKLAYGQASINLPVFAESRK